MENIRFIKDKIKSCVSCNEDQCPFIKERWERHVLSHHSSIRQRDKSQQMKLGRLSGSVSSKSALTMTTSNEQTSTSDLITVQLDKRTKKMVYKNRLEAIINEWAKLLPKYPNASAENLKQNIVNELIEKLNNISSEANQGYYDIKLAIEIDEFIDSLPSLTDNTPSDSDLDNLKEILVKEICDLNKNIINNDNMNRKPKKQEYETVIKVKDNASNTQQSFKNNLKYTETQKNETNTPYTSLSDNNGSVTELNMQENDGKKLVDVQVQQSFSSFKPIYGKMFKEPIYKIDKQQNTDIIKNVYRTIISKWLDNFTRNLDKNEKDIITDAILNRLKPLLNKKYTLNHKILLKAEVLNCLNDYTIILISPENYSKINRIIDDLVVKLLEAKLNNENVYSIISKSYFHNSNDKIMHMNFESNKYFDPIVQNIVSEKLENLNLSNQIRREIIYIIMQNIKLICMRQDRYIEMLIFDILQHYTELSDYCISNIVKSILDEVRIIATNNYLQIYNSASLNDSFKPPKPSLISVYKSEHEMRGPKNGLSSFRRKSSDNNYPQLTAEERTYLDNISALIKAWLTILPTKGSKTGSKQIKDDIINNLGQDILDQVKLEQIVPETRVEKEKYLSFFIHRWLHKLNCFENIADAQPYAEQLIEKLKNIPFPCTLKNNNDNQTSENDEEIIKHTMSCARRECIANEAPIKNNDKDSNIQNKSEVIIKEFIAKFIEHNYDEDNPITREVFGNILKTELQKLSTPTRKKVYGNLNNQIDNIVASEKLASELRYINITSDWFKTLPLDSSFNVTGNKQRAQCVNDLAKIISELEENRLKAPPDMDYDRHLKSVISQFTHKLPITKQYSQDISFLIEDFVAKIASLRPPTPCCAYVNERDLSINVSGIPDQSLSEFVEAYIRDNSDEIDDDELKLDAWSLRILEEVDNIASDNPTALSTSEVYNRLADISVQGDDIGKRFNLELSYAKEISNWLNNLPLKPMVDKSAKDLRIEMISDLAEKMSVRWHTKHIDPNNSQVDVDLEDYIQKWIKELPLDRSKEIVLSLAIQQILNRMERVNTGKQVIPLQQEPPKYSNNMCKSPHPCCNRHIANKLKMIDPGAAIVEAIENWCKTLPIKSETDINSNTLKEEFSTKLYKKIGELNKNPKYFNNNYLYLEILEEEIDSGFDNLPQNPKLQNSRQKLKQQILDVVNENRNLMREKAAGVEYRQELAKTIEMSLPNPVQLQQKCSPGFNIYKNRLVELFILENFDYTQDDVKLNYVRKLRHQIDEYYQEVPNMNTLPLTKEQMFNELYSSLFSVPSPNEMYIAEEVEEIKTRCEIESWFESLPIREATGMVELFEWDQILSMLAKRIHYMEKHEKNPDDNIQKEIMKWLLKLPIVSGQEKNFSHIANDLQQRLKLTLNDRKCKSRDANTTREEITYKNKNKNKGILGTSQVAGPSSDGMPWLSPPSSPLSDNLQNSPKRPSDLILEIVERWCHQLPLPENTQQEKDTAKILKDNLVVKIIMKISELNVNSETFENDILYDVILDDELENLISSLPTSNELIQNKTKIKNQLKDAIKSVKPLIMQEKARYEYKQELKNTVDQVLEQPPNAPPEKVALFITLRDEIVDNFVAYSFCKDDEEGQELHKVMVHDAVEKYFVGKKNTRSDEVPDPLIKGNQLLCELSKIPAPDADVILEEIHEIRMKFQISDLFKELSFPEDANKLALKNQVKSTLARRLSDFNKSSFIQNRQKVRDYIMKCLQKIQHEIDPQKVETFIKKLETSENRRKSQISPENIINSSSPNQDTKNRYQTYYNGGEEFANNEHVEDEQWISLLPVTPRVRDPNYHDTIEVREYRKSLGEAGSPREPGQAFDRSITQSGISYDKFKEVDPLTSSRITKQQPIQGLSNFNNNPRTVTVPNQHPNNSAVFGHGYQPIDNRGNQTPGSYLRNYENSGQQQSLVSHNIQPRFTQQIDTGPDWQKTFTPPQFQNSGSQSQLQNTLQNRRRSNTFIKNQPTQSQSSQQSRYLPNQNQMSTSTLKRQSNTLVTSSQNTLQSLGVSPQQNQYREPSPYQQISSPQNISEPCRFVSPSDSTPPMPQFSSQTPYSSPKCNKSCRRPSITLLKQPRKLCYSNNNNNQDTEDNIMPISDDEDTICLCNNKRRKQCRSIPACTMHQRKQCKICNGVNPFFYSTPPYRRYYQY